MKNTQASVLMALAALESFARSTLSSIGPSPDVHWGALRPTNVASTFGYKRPSRAKLGLPPRDRTGTSTKQKSRAKAKASRKQSVKTRKGK